MNARKAALPELNYFKCTQTHVTKNTEFVEKLCFMKEITIKMGKCTNLKSDLKKNLVHIGLHLGLELDLILSLGTFLKA